MLDPAPSRRTTCARSTRRSSTRRAPTRSGARSRSSSSRGGSRSGATCGSRRRRWRRRVHRRRRRRRAPTSPTSGWSGRRCVYFATGELGLDGGIMVTASHNPGEYTGMKIVRRGALPVGSESGLLEVRDRAVRGEWREATRGDGRARVDVWDALRRARCSAFVDVDGDRAAAGRRRRGERDGRRDAAAGARAAAAGRGRSLLLRAGRVVPEPRAESAAAGEPRVHRARRRVEEGAAFGVAYDGDADRCFFVDDTRRVRARATSSRRCSRERMLAREPGGKVIYDVRASWAVPRGDRARRAACR